MKDNKVVIDGREIGPNDEFETYFQTSYKAGRLYLLSRTDTGMVIMPEQGSKVYALAAKYNVINARCKLLKVVTTNRNTAFAVARILDWQPVI